MTYSAIQDEPDAAVVADAATVETEEGSLRTVGPVDRCRHGDEEDARARVAA